MKSKRTRRERGFTMIELLVSVVVVGILAGISVPNLMGAKQKALTASVKCNMKVCQVAAEQYAVDYAGTYPADPSNLLTYYPGGTSFPLNPITNQANEIPAPCSLNAYSDISSARQSTAPANYGGGEGQSTYAALPDESGSMVSYAITGNGVAAEAVRGDNGHLVLSNQ